MRKSSKLPFLVLLSTFLFNILIVGSTIVMHESGHYITAIAAGCKKIRLVFLDSEVGTYTEMSCPTEQPPYFATVGALFFTVPFALGFLLLRFMPERNIFWISLGFNFTIMVLDIPEIMFLRPLSFAAGLILFTLGEVWLIDSLFEYIGKEEGLVI